uniref:pyridoxal-phosphate dependent enzyme n=1 Tax=Escherichia coli TaxID=562 RepID=UPI002283BEB2
RYTADREQIALRIQSETGATLIPPYDHEDVIAGQGTVALEMLEDQPQLDMLVIAIGGGGLGDLAIRYGYQRFQSDVMAAVVIVLIVLVQLIQSLGDRYVRRISHR